MCPQVKAKPCPGDWRAPGLLLLLALVIAGAVAGGLLGFTHSPPKVSSFWEPEQGQTVGRGRKGQHLSARQWSQGSEQWPEDQRGGGVRNSAAEPGGGGGGCLGLPHPAQLSPGSPISASAADAPSDPPKPWGTPVQPNCPGGCGPEHGNHPGDLGSEQPQLGSAIRRAEREWAGGVVSTRGCSGGLASPACLPRAASATAPWNTRPASSARWSPEIVRPYSCW